MQLPCSFCRAAWNIHVISIENLRQNPTISSWKFAFCGSLSTGLESFASLGIHLCLGSELGLHETLIRFQLPA